MASFLCLLFVVTVDFARLFQYQITLNNCARNGALFGANLRSYQEAAWVQPDNDIISATLADGATLNPPLTSSGVTTANGTGSDGNPNVTVTISYTFTPYSPIPGFGRSVPLHATCSMRVAP